MRSTATQEPARSLDLLCGCQVVEVFAPGQSCLAAMDGGRAVVFKRVPDDCLNHGRLHPGVRQRLARVREVAEPSVAHLLSVERDDDSAWLIWQWIDGAPLNEWLDEAPAEGAVLRVMRELVLVTESLHVRGLVHGAIHAGNVIIDASGRVRLTHLSPLLHDDPATDERAVAALLGRMAKQALPEDHALHRALESLPAQSALRSLACVFAGQGTAQVAVGRVQHQDVSIRRGSVAAAWLSAIFGILIAAAIAWVAWPS